MRVNWISLVIWIICWNQQWRSCWHWHWMRSRLACHPYYQSKLIIFKSTDYYLLLRRMPLKSLYSIFLCWLNCVYLRIYVWTGSSQCFMTQCTIETACLTPGVTKQGYKSQKCEISINHNLASLTKQWIARQIIGNLTRTKHGSHATSWDQCLLVCLTIVTWPLVTQVWPGNLCTLPTLPLLIITIHQPLACSPLGYQGEEVKLPAAMLSQVTPDSVSQWMGI